MLKIRDTHTERHATLYGCLPSLLGDEDIKELKKCMVRKNILYWADNSSQGRTKISCASTTRLTNQPSERTLSLCSLSPPSSQQDFSMTLVPLSVHPILAGCSL
jgi:hypothetical protein